MEKWKRLIYYLMINVLVSACTVLVVLTIWDRYNTPQVVDVAAPVAASELPLASLMPTAAEALVIPSTNTPGPVPNLSVEEYEVQFGDTLGIIAQKFDIPIEELMEVNQLDDPNSISVGLIVYIPVTPQVLPTHTPSPTKTPNPLITSGTPAPTQEAKVVINSVISAGELTSERVFLTRTGDGELNLAGWKLEDEDGNIFVFPQLALYKDGAVNVWTTSGSATVVDLYWGIGSSVWVSGETVTLRDARGKVQTTYTIP
jgi:LysM repeat protein